MSTSVKDQDVLAANHDRVLALWESGLTDEQVAANLGVKASALVTYYFKLTGGQVGRRIRQARDGGKALRAKARKAPAA